MDATKTKMVLFALDGVMHNHHNAKTSFFGTNEWYMEFILTFKFISSTLAFKTQVKLSFFIPDELKKKQ